MRSVYKRSFIAILSLFLIILAGADMTAYAQGKGRGGGGGGNKHGGGGNPGGGPPARQQGPPQRQQMQRPQPQFQRPQMQAQRPQPQYQRPQQMQRMQRPPQPQFQRPQPQFQRPQQMQKMQRQQVQAQRPQFQRPQQLDRRAYQIQRPQPQFDRRAYQVQRPQPQFDRGQFKADRPQQKFERQELKRAQKFDRQAPQAWAGLDDRSARSRGRNAGANNAWPNNYGYQRSTEVHERNAARRSARNSVPLSTFGYDDYGYTRQVRVAPYDRNSLRDDVLRNVVVTTLAAVTGNNYYTPQYPQYVETYSYGSPYYGYYNDGGYDWDNPQYTSYSQPLYYNFYDPYVPYVTYSSYDDGYTNYGTPYYADYYADDVGLPYLAESSSIGGFVGRLFSELLAYGYNQGYRDAQYARSQGYNTRYFDDPYDPYVYTPQSVVYQDIGYNPYSCFGENRRYVSEGYELGYRDALYGDDQYDAYGYDTGNNVDLVSALISAVISIV